MISSVLNWSRLSVEYFACHPSNEELTFPTRLMHCGTPGVFEILTRTATFSRVVRTLNLYGPKVRSWVSVDIFKPGHISVRRATGDKQLRDVERWALEAPKHVHLFLGLRSNAYYLLDHENVASTSACCIEMWFYTAFSWDNVCLKWLQCILHCTMAEVDPCISYVTVGKLRIALL